MELVRKQVFGAGGALPRWGGSEQMVGAAREECGGAALGAGLGPAPGTG